jgi:hypothetical protein
MAVILLVMPMVFAEQTVKTIELPIGYVAQTSADTDYIQTKTIKSPDGITDIISMELIIRGDFQADTEVSARVRKTGNGQVFSCEPSTWTTPNIDALSYETSFDCSSLVNQFNFISGQIDLGMRTNKVAQNIKGNLRMTYLNKPRRMMNVKGTEYQTTDGNVGKVFLQLLDDNKVPITNSSCYATIYNPDTTVWINKSLMNYVAEGLHHLDFSIPNVTGVYMVSAFCDIPHSTNLTANDSFECGGYNCGSGWNSAWVNNSDVEVTTSGSPRDSYHMKVSGTDGLSGSLVANFKFDETSGTVLNDYSPLNNDGTYYNSPNLTITGIDNTGIAFDGVDDYASVPYNSNYNIASDEELMICLGINTNGDGVINDLRILDYMGATGYEIKGHDDDIRFTTNKLTSGMKNHDTTYQFDDSNWHTLCFFANNTQMLSYVDGSFDKQTNTIQSGTMSPSLTMYFGAESGTSLYYNDSLDEVCIIKGTSLNVSDIVSQYNTTRSCVGLFGSQSSGQANRSLDLSISDGNCYATFWTKANSFSTSSTCDINYYNGSDYTTLLTLDNDDDNNIYRYYSYEVCGAYGKSASSGLQIDSLNLISSSGCYIDDIKFIIQDDYNETIYERVRGSGEVHVNDWFTQVINVTENIQIELGNVTVDIGNVSEEIWSYENRTVIETEQEAMLFISGTEYQAGEDGKVAIRLSQSGKNALPITNADCDVTILYPNESIFINDTNMTEFGTGIYSYDFTTPYTLGVYTYYTDCLESPNKYYYGMNTFHVFDVNDRTNYTLIAESVWSWNGSISDNILNFFSEAVWNWTGDVHTTLLNNLANYIWNYAQRNLTYYEDVTNYTLINEEVWSYYNRTLTINIPFEVWNYTDRNLTYYPNQTCNPTLNATCELDYNLTASDIWNFAPRNLTYYELANVSNLTVSINESAIIKPIECFIIQYFFDEEGWGIDIPVC